jgi:mono-ADP-ribosyltransferase sirtuin 6
MNCCDPTCGKAVTTEDCSVRVRFDHGARLPFETSTSGVAVFHETCWQTQLMAKQRTLRTIVREANELAEFFDSRACMEESVDHVVELLGCSKHAVLFSGAGISTSAGIGDFRGLFGQWTQDERFSNNLEDDSATDNVPYEELIPTLAHEAVVWLVDQGIIQHVITQNCDGLHRLSGIQPDKLSELHGNIFIEYCEKCGREYERNFNVENFQANEYFEELEDLGKTKIRKPKRAKQCKRCKLTHHTERCCKGCKVPLNDTIINFGDYLRDSQMQPATEHSKQADLMVVWVPPSL